MINKGTNILEKGITLIALVVTIIVLLILAGITINIALGSNGLIERTKSAQEVNKKESGREQINLETMASINDDGTINMELLNANLSNIPGLIYNDNPLSETNKISSLPAKVKLNDCFFLIKKDCEIELVRTYSNEITQKLMVNTTNKTSPYIEYKGELYRVLYDMNSGYEWIEIISVNTLEMVNLGYNDLFIPETLKDGNEFEKEQWSYNNAIETLNKVAQKYLSEIADRARCVGSLPTNPLNENAKHDFPEDFYRKQDLKGRDSNYTRGSNAELTVRDKDQMDLLGLTRCNNHYWLASRWVSGPGDYIHFVINTVKSNRRIK